jgi:HD-like signal output (HDOD) protein
VLAQQCPRELERAACVARERQIPMHVAETATIGASFAEVGAYLLGIWGLPHAIIEAVAFQNDPGQIHQTGFDVLAALVTAEKLTPADKSYAPHSCASGASDIDEAYLRKLNAPFDWAEAQARAQRALGDS